MSTAFEERFRKLGSPFNGAPPQNGLRAGRKARIRNDYSGSQLLTDLLGAVPVDLARISEHIRSHPEIADLIIRLAASLLLSADSSITIEDAAVMLGTDRLNVLASMWSIMEKYDEGGRAEKSPDLAARSADNPRTLQAEDFADLRNLLMRDFLALLPTLNPFSSKADCANSAGEA